MANSDDPKTGADFERDVREIFARNGISLVPNFQVEVGVASETRPHKFDLGSASPSILVECEAHTWTEGGNAPSAKLSVWNEAMYYFAVAPTKFRRILFARRSVRRGITLGEHYLKRYSHLVPEGVEIWELDLETGAANCAHPARRAGTVSAP